MKATFIFIVVAGVALLIAFGVRDIVGLGMGLSASASQAPEHFRDAFGTVLACGIQHKGLSTAAFIACLAAPFIRWNPTIKER